MVSIAPFSTKNGLDAGASAGPLTLASLRPYHREQLIASFEYTDNFNIIDLPGIFTPAMADEKNVEYVVRFRLGGTFTSTQVIQMRLYLDNTLATSSDYWAYGNGLQNSTSAYNQSQTNQPQVELCGGTSRSVWQGEILFPHLRPQRVAENGATYWLSAVYSVTNLAFASGSPTMSWGSCGLDNTVIDGSEIVTGFQLFTQPANDSYKIGKTERTGDLPIFVSIYRRERAL